MSWNKIKHRFTSHKAFWACVDKEGNWFDSAQSFEVAVHWCAMYFSPNSDREFDEEVKIMEEQGYSIIHSTFLETLAKAGLIK